MRHSLADRAGRRLAYAGRLTAYGVRHPKGQPRKVRGRALISPVCAEDGTWLVDHVWLPYAEPFLAAGVEKGQRVRFTAVASAYVRRLGFPDAEEDYTLEDAQDVVLMEEERAQV